MLGLMVRRVEVVKFEERKVENMLGIVGVRKGANVVARQVQRKKEPKRACGASKVSARW